MAKTSLRVVNAAPAGSMPDGEAKDVARTGTHEIIQLSALLREFILQHDETGEIVDVARGILLRIETVADAVYGVVMDGLPADSSRRDAVAVYGR